MTGLTLEIKKTCQAHSIILWEFHLPFSAGNHNYMSSALLKRMSWASRRKTTRTEDIAYCMLGIFNVNMPLLCGEKGKAFIRLQEEIMKDSDDQTLFAWENEDISPDKWRGLLAYSPAEFENSGDIIQFRHSDAPFPFSVTNRGTVLQLPLATYPGKRTFRTDVTNRTRTFESWVYPDRRDPRLKIVILECLDTALGGPRLVGITLSRNPDQKSQYVRCGPDQKGKSLGPGFTIIQLGKFMWRKPPWEEDKEKSSAQEIYH